MASIFDVYFSPLDEPEFFKEVDRLITRGAPEYVVTPNLDFARLSAKHPEFRAALNGAKLSLCDGQVLYKLLKIKRDSVPAKLSGSDLTPRLLDHAVANDYRVYLFGSDEKTLRMVEERYPSAVVGWDAPPFRPKLWEEDELNATYIERIRELKPDMVFVALGAMKQEFWAQRYCREYDAPLSFCIGASLDFISSKVKRAPQLVSKVGMEWAWRLAMEPGRLWKRYGSDAVFLLKNLPGLFSNGKPEKAV